MKLELAMVLGIIYTAIMVPAVTYLLYKGKLRKELGWVVLVISALLGFAYFAPMFPWQLQLLMLGKLPQANLPMVLLVLSIVVLSSLWFGRVFCGYVCPPGRCRSLRTRPHQEDQGPQLDHPQGPPHRLRSDGGTGRLVLFQPDQGAGPFRPLPARDRSRVGDIPGHHHRVHGDLPPLLPVHMSLRGAIVPAFLEERFRRQKELELRRLRQM